MNVGKKKIVFFDFAIHFGGSRQSTLLIARELQKYCDVTVLDAYGTCRPYLETVKDYAIRNIVAQPNPKRSYIGGANLLDRIFRAVSSAGEMFDLVRRLRQTIKEISPNVISITGFKSLFFVSRAVGKMIPIAYYARREGTYPRWYVKHDWMNISLITGISESCFSRLRNSPYEVPIMEVVPNGIDIDKTIKLASVKPQNIPSGGGLRVVVPASLLANKNQDIAIKGLAKYVRNGGDGSLWLCGDCFEGADSTYADSLPILAKELNIADRVCFLGWRDNVPSLIAQCDIAALISHSESFGRVFLEAMCLQKPVIGTRVGGIPEVVRDGVDGILIDVDDSEGFACTLERLSDPKLRQKMGAAGLERVKSSFDIKTVASRYYELISKIC